jgi:hypothetical protein
MLVMRLQDALGFDPFSNSDDVCLPVTLGDFISLYEDTGRKAAVT